MNNARRITLLAAATLALSACGGDSETPAEAGAKLPEDACAQLALTEVISKSFGEAELVTDKTEGTESHCVWVAPATDISESGASVEVTIVGASGADLKDEWDDTVAKSVAPADWRPTGSIRRTEATPEGDWDTAHGVDLSLLLTSRVTRQLSFRNGQGTNYVAHAAVALDASKAASPQVAAVADAALAAVPGLFD